MKHVLMVAFGALSFGMLSSFAKIAYGQGYTAGEITFTQSAIGALVLWMLVLVRSTRNDGFKLSWNRHLLFAGLCMGTSAYTYYLSVAYIPASLAIVLLMQMTWMSMLMEWLVFRIKPSKPAVTAAALILIGTVFAGGLAGDQLHFSWTGIILALLSALLYSAYVGFTSKLDKDMPVLGKSAIITTGSAIVILMINLKSMTTSTHLDPGLLQWGSFLALFGTIIPPMCFTAGMPRIGAGLSAVLLTLELPAAVFCAHVILGEDITALQIVGVVLMLGAIIYMNLAKSGVPKFRLMGKLSHQPGRKF